MPQTENPPPPPRHAEGMRRFNAGDREGALAFFADTVRAYPGDAQAHYFHGIVLFRLERFREAAEALRRSADLVPGEDALIKLAMAQGQLKDMPACLATLEEAARRLPHSATVRAYLGTTLRSMDRLEEALAAYRAALERDPGHVPALWGLGLALGMAGRPAEGMGALRQAIERDPTFPPPHFHLGVLALAAGDPGETRRQEALLRNLAPSYADRLAQILTERTTP